MGTRRGEQRIKNLRKNWLYRFRKSLKRLAILLLSEEFKEMVEMDLTYIQNRSTLLDIIIMLKTVKGMIVGEEL
ncbi:sugar transferase [Bacillus sp. AGMB 02131]|uniref:Sugar transferase n=1 Tax=Peribacillus faecalis TaxID=2772559 RepID=A0A927CYD0_9BACI|nr:sugar transferase [Peribacillus faecalis]MBD3107594.1 sugar transferase [Peribacillus faecalis]